MQVYVKTFGCKVNYAESATLLDALAQAGHSAWELHGAQLPAAAASSGESALPQAVAVIVNSCCVTAEAERKAAQFVRRIRREHPQAKLLFCGCAARNPASQKLYADAGAQVLGTVEEAAALLGAGLALPAEAADSAPAAPDAAGLAATRVRAFIKVQDGCANCCSYCIVPFVRPYASRPLAEILAEAQQQLAAGQRELVLTGINIGHYGMQPLYPPGTPDTGPMPPDAPRYAPIPGYPTLCDVIAAVLKLVPEGCRLRLSSIEPEDLDLQMFELLAHARLCPHLHLPLQSGSDRVLQTMGRRYSAAQYLQLAQQFRQACPQGALTTDIMAGFPGESEEDFAKTLELCSAAGFERAHCFAFSPRPGTRAALMPQHPRPLVQQRNRRLIAHCRQVAAGRLKRYIGQQVQLLVEQLATSQQGISLQGYAEAYQEVHAQVSAGQASSLPAGSLVAVELTGLADGRFSAILV